MGSEANAVQLGNGEVKPVKLEESGVNIEAKNVVKHSLPTMMPASLDARGEGINLPLNFTSPSTVLTSPLELACVAAHGKCHAPGSPDASSPETPKNRSFDPFAPRTGELKAPRGSKYSREASGRSTRSLNYGSSVRLPFEEYCESDEENALVEERFLENLYKDFVEVIVSTQVYSVQHDTFLDEALLKHVMLDGFKTPEPLLTGIADTCPPAPLRFEHERNSSTQEGADTPAWNALIMDKGLRRKLDF